MNPSQTPAGDQPVSGSREEAGSPASDRQPATKTPACAADHDASAAGKSAKPGTRGLTKTEILLKKLKSSKGVSLAMMVKETGWQAHSVRGFLSRTVRNKLGLTLLSEVGHDGTRRYRVAGPKKAI